MCFGALLGATYARIHSPQETRLTGAAPRTNWAAQLPHSIDAITAALTRLPLPLPTPQQYVRGAGRVRWLQRHYDVLTSAPEDPEVVRSWFATVEQSAPAVGARLNEDANGVEVQIGVDGLLTHTLTLRWLGRSPRAAIVLADFGNDLAIARAASSLGLPVTLAVNPQGPFAPQIAELAKLANLELLIVLPAHADPDVVDKAIALLPRAVGLYVDTDRLPFSKERLQQVLAHAATRQRFHVDASADTNARLCAVASEAGSACVMRDVLLDANGDAESTRLQLESAMTLVRTRGDVVVVGSVRPMILAVLRELVPAFAAARIEIVPLSLIVADRRSLSAR